MAWFQLDPHRIADSSTPEAAAPTLLQSVVRGIGGFTLVSVAGFAPWALAGKWLYPYLGEAGLYALCALVFIILSGPLMHRLILGRGSLWRFYALFTPAFTLYAASWITCWFSRRGTWGNLSGLLLGTFLFAILLTVAFSALKELPRIFPILFLCNAAGYYAGEWAELRLISDHMVAAMLLWGVFYGIGFGAGLGAAFWFCHREARTAIAQRW
jgi:hypothetical protein